VLIAKSDLFENEGREWVFLQIWCV